MMRPHPNPVLRTPQARARLRLVANAGDVLPQGRAAGSLGAPSPPAESLDDDGTVCDPGPQHPADLRERLLDSRAHERRGRVLR